ncbi:helix-turn-helix domain-containing protein [Williamsia sp. DF01-3]|uniref:helix-turn-helix domain-containing protein n=1 Tax=Williamsia sp. DF01-3 TaxID=2934157 RepID=UPI0027E24BC4|nr:helix-turn-helix domain-containing protein [Williamsia sp. DF01-3]
MTRRLYTVKEAALMTGLSRASIYNRLSAGDIRSVKVGSRRLFPDTAIDEFIERLEEQAARGGSGVA